MARLGPTLAALRAAARGRSDADKPSGALRLLSAYFIGFILIRTGANAYIFFANLEVHLGKAEAYGLALMMTALSAGPLAAALALSRGRVDAERRLALLPLESRERLAIAALGPLVAELPVITLAAALPLASALPLAAWSTVGWLGAALWYALAGASCGMILKSAAGALRSLVLRKAGDNRGRRVALAMSLAALALSNPHIAVGTDGASLSLFSTMRIPASAAPLLAFPLERPAEALALLTAGLLAAAAAAVAEDAAGRLTGDGWPMPPRRPAARRRDGPFWAMLPVADKERDAAWSFAAALALAVAAVVDGAAPAIPLALGTALFGARAGAALAFIATDSPTTRRFAVMPAKPGAVDRAYLCAAVALAALVASPLAVAALMLAAA